jgi:hypothetical protein
MGELLSVLQSLLVGCVIGVAIILVAASVLLLFFDTDSVKQRKLKRLASAEFEQARGTAHRQLLEAAAHPLNAQIREFQRLIQAANKQKRDYLEIRDRKLRSNVAQWLVETRLQEVHGIGNTLKSEIIRTVFHGDLNDLRQAYRVDGVGPERQEAINHWITHYQKQIPYYLTKYFPGKEEILQEYERAVLAQDRLIQEYEAAQKPIKERLVPINRELSWLKEVKAKDFFQAYQDPEFERGDEIDRYFRGVFAEWEPMPDWFRAEVRSGAD